MKSENKNTEKKVLKLKGETKDKYDEKLNKEKEELKRRK